MDLSSATLFMTIYFACLAGIPASNQGTGLQDYRVKRKEAKLQRLPINPIMFDQSCRRVYDSAYDYFKDVGVIIDDQYAQEHSLHHYLFQTGAPKAFVVVRYLYAFLWGTLLAIFPISIAGTPKL